MTTRLLIGLAAIAALAGCGDDLESRQSAVQERTPGRDLSGQQPQPRETRLTVQPAPATKAEGFADDDALSDDGEVIEDATPDALIDSAQGFSTDPIDDTSGLNPSPEAPQGFAPESIEPESFAE
ncbi:hypothetical protein [Aurantiacibacter rhizosphaerae]|uniref:DUF3035 domain-containing protein n=1 Tax=Aurantiacibacter rhizosphaerae TaxID=2691582 RepID=A0A844XEW1_9SPHN|nr:hypothetical protein [Aurantiacibacter rhizosphaerae]MWV29121.1 hypothetical protein [Aurantiacibacter rhizosphaerae]